MVLEGLEVVEDLLFGGELHGRLRLLVGDVRARASLHQKADRRGVALLRCNVQLVMMKEKRKVSKREGVDTRSKGGYRRLLDLVLLVELGPTIDEQRHDLHITLGSRPVEGRVAVLVQLVDLGALRHEQLCNVAVALAAPIVQRRPARHAHTKQKTPGIISRQSCATTRGLRVLQ